LDRIAEHRPALHHYCLRLTGNVWDAEDLVQDALLRVFGVMAKSDTKLDNPKAYLIRAASNMWIDRVRRAVRTEELAEIGKGEPAVAAQAATDVTDATSSLFQDLHPQERAAILMKEVFDLSLDETANMLGTTVGAVKSALSRARGRL